MTNGNETIGAGSIDGMPRLKKTASVGAIPPIEYIENTRPEVLLKERQTVVSNLDAWAALEKLEITTQRRHGAHSVCPLCHLQFRIHTDIFFAAHIGPHLAIN